VFFSGHRTEEGNNTHPSVFEQFNVGHMVNHLSFGISLPVSVRWMLNLESQLDCATRTVMDGRSSHEKEIYNMKKMLEIEKEDKATIVRKWEKILEDVKTQMNAQMMAQKETLGASIADLSNSLDVATIDLHQKNALLEEKTAKKVDLAELPQISMVEVAVQELVISIKQITQQMTMLIKVAGLVLVLLALGLGLGVTQLRQNHVIRQYRNMHARLKIAGLALDHELSSIIRRRGHT
jgi:hypothetical protein